MTDQETLARGRTRPSQVDSDEEEDELELETTDESDVQIPPGYRAKVKVTKPATAQFPSAPLYSINESVYVLAGENQQPRGPFVVESIAPGNKYTLKWQNTQALLQELVSEQLLVVPTG